jgi:hypothetical protein
MAKRIDRSPRANSKPNHLWTHNNHPSDGELWQDCEYCDWLRANPDEPETLYYRTIIKDLTGKREDLMRELGIHRRPRTQEEP